MTERDAHRRAAAALREICARVGDDEEAATRELLALAQRDADLHRALEVLGAARLWQSQNQRH